MILSQSTNDPTYRFFDDIISGQLDCDKMDYLLRDSYYCGVEYGTYDLEKLIHSMRVVKIAGNHVLAVDQSGIQVVEEFVLARYWMFIQVYFHKDRRLFDYYLSSFMKEYLTLEEEKTGQYSNNLEQYLRLDDSKIDCKIQYYAELYPDLATKKYTILQAGSFTGNTIKLCLIQPMCIMTKRVVMREKITNDYILLQGILKIFKMIQMI